MSGQRSRNEIVMQLSIERQEKRSSSQTVPRPLPNDPGLVVVDATWSMIQPMQLADSVRAVDELEVIEHLEQGLPVLDSLTSDLYRQSTLPGAENIPHAEIVERMDELDPERPIIFFCNGPQCGQSPAASRSLLDAGYPPERMLYNRGGLHGWMTLGLPTTSGKESR